MQRDSAKTRTIKANPKNDIVLLSRRPLSNNTKTTRPISSSSTLRSNTSSKTVSYESVSITKYGSSGTKSAPTISTRVKPPVVSSAKKTETKTENSKRWFGVPTKTKNSTPLPTQAKPPTNSTHLLHHNNNNNEVKIHGKLKKPIDSSKVSSRRGQSQASSKSEQGQLQGQIREDLSRSSSVTNLHADHKNKGAFSKLRKSASKDKLDKLAEKKNEKKGIPSNNNKLDSGEVDHSLESLQEIELLQRQLTEMAKEKSDLALELGERKGELQILKNEIVKLKMFQDQSNVRIDQLNDENTSLRNRLRDVAHSPLSDNEKQQLLESHRHSSAPASIATNLLEDSNVGDITACPTPDWDKHSSSNVSEVSVACLQDKINQMQETHYSTNEELQATLQELTDLQRQLTELQQDNERLLDEKNLMFDSLCRQTERLNDARAEVESLKQLLYRDKDETGQFESIVDREQKLVDLLKSAQEERENLLVKQEQLSNELQDARTANIEQITEIEQLTERVRTLESTLDAKHAEHRQLDQELAIAKDQCSGRQIEINRLTDLLENARTKINELEQERALNDKSELDELLDNARKEKDALESEVANLKEQVARSRNETDKLREQVSILQEECKVTRNNAKCTQSELEYKCEKLTADKTNLNDQLQQLQEAANELQVQAQCQLEDKRQLSSVLSETQRNLSEAERKNTELGTEVEELKRLRKEENEEWEKFQNDLLTSVRVANDFKSEAQQELQKMIMENKAHRERVRQLEAQIDKLKGNSGEVNQETKEPSSHNYQITGIPDSTLEVCQVHEKENTALKPNTFAHTSVVLQTEYREQFKDLEAQQNSNSSFSDISNTDIKPTNTELDPTVSDNSVLKKSLKFLPTLSIISRKGNAKQEPPKKVQAPARLSNDSDSTKNFVRYADSSKIINSSSTTAIAEPIQEKPQPVKKRKATKTSPKHTEKRLSDQEERDLALLFNLSSQIDQNTPKEQLTEEQKLILKMKDVFDSESSNPKLKPVAKTSKDKLAISKPLLTSVLNNPKLKEITEDSRMADVENDSPSEALKDDPFSSEFKEFVTNDPNFSKRYEMILKPDTKFDDLFQSNIEFSYYDKEQRPKSLLSFKPEAIISKSKSLDDIYYKDRLSNEAMSCNNNSYDFPNPHNEPPVVESSHPLNIHRNNADLETTNESELKKNVTFENLDALYAKIDHNLPEDQLTKEEIFIVKLKQSLDEMGRKNTLRRIAIKRKKKLKISEPTETSILMNPKLVSILNNPSIKAVNEAKQPNEETQNRLSGISLTSSVEISEIEEPNDEDLTASHKKSMSYEDISANNPILDPNFEFKIPRAKLISSTPNISSDSKINEASTLSSFSTPHLLNYSSTDEFNKSSGRYIKNKQEEHFKWETAPFYRVKRAYDLQVLRPSFDKRKISLNEPESDSEAIVISPKPVDAINVNFKSELLSDEDTQSDHETTDNVFLYNKKNSDKDDYEQIKTIQGEESNTDSPKEIETSLNMDFQSEDMGYSKNTTHALETIQEMNPEQIRMCNFEVNDSDPSFGSIIVPRIRTMSDTSSYNEYVLSSLKSRLDEDEFDLVQRIQSSSDYSRPNSELNEEDLELIAAAQQQCSQEDDVEGLSSLRPRLDEDELGLVERIQSSDCTRSKSGLNEEDLKLIALAQQQYPQKDDMGDRDHFKTEIDKTDAIEEDDKNRLLETKTESDELASTAELHCNRKDSGLSANNNEKVIECYNNNVDDKTGFQTEKIRSSSAIENPLSSPRISFKNKPVLPAKKINSNNQSADGIIRSSATRSALHEPIYANYSMFLKQMIHEDDKEQEILLVTKKQPLPLPRTKSINEDPPRAVKTINKVEIDNLSQNFDRRDVVDSAPASPLDISKITRDISNLTSSLENLEDIHQHTNRDMITGSQSDIDEISVGGATSNTAPIIEKTHSSYSTTVETQKSSEGETHKSSTDEEVVKNINKIESLGSTTDADTVFGGTKRKHSSYLRTNKTCFEDTEKQKSSKDTSLKSSAGRETTENTVEANTSNAASVKVIGSTDGNYPSYSKASESSFGDVEKCKSSKNTALKSADKESFESADTINTPDAASLKGIDSTEGIYSSYSKASVSSIGGLEKCKSSRDTTPTSPSNRKVLENIEESNSCGSASETGSLNIYGSKNKYFSDSRNSEVFLEDLPSRDTRQNSSVDRPELEDAEVSTDKTGEQGYLSKSNIKVFGNVEKYKALEFINELDTKINDGDCESKHPTSIELATSAVKFFGSEKISSDVHVAKEERNFSNARVVELTHKYKDKQKPSEISEEGQNSLRNQLIAGEVTESLNKTEEEHNRFTESEECQNLMQNQAKAQDTEQRDEIEDLSTGTADKDDHQQLILENIENNPNPDQTSTTVGFSFFGIIDKLGYMIHAVTTAAQSTVVTENVATDSCCTKSSLTQTEPAIVEHHVRRKSKTKRTETAKETTRYDSLERVAAFHILNNPPISHPQENPQNECRYHSVLPKNNPPRVSQQGHEVFSSSANTNYNINLDSFPQQCPHVLDFNRQSGVFNPSIPNFKFETSASNLRPPSNRSSIGDSIKKFETMIQTNQQQNMQFKSETLKATFTKFKQANVGHTSPAVGLEQQEANNSVQILENASVNVPPIKDKPLQ